MEGRQQERERIARELHDTLLQGTQALILAFHSIVKELPQGSSLRDRCERSLDRADQMLGEGRDKVQELRADEAMQEDIARSLTLACDELLEWSANTRVVHRVDGVQRTLRRPLREQVYRIGREALVNAFKHSRAATIEVTVTYGLRQFELCIRDDGIGGDHESFMTNAGDQHWGIRGMRERAQSLGGELRIFNNHPSGLAVELIIEAASAYEPSRT